ncbi:Uncharacterised protein [Klebsiella pneumoniae]|nr:Uncharacterised protein [Klebsiella pneumoniae]
MRSLAYCASSAVTVATGVTLQIIAGGPHLHPGQIAADRVRLFRHLMTCLCDSGRSRPRDIGKQLFTHSRRQQTGEFPSNSCGQNALRVMMACSGGSRRR